MADDLREILEQAKRDCPDVPPHAWSSIERSIRNNFGATKPYIATHKKRLHLEQMAEMDAAATAEQIAQKLGVTVQYARRLKKLR